MANEQMIYNILRDAGLTHAGAAGVMGNLKHESGLRGDNLQNSFEGGYRGDDAQYTSMVDSGAYGNFAGDGAGYGLAQWTSPGRKAGLLDYAQSTGRSIGDAGMQAEYLIREAMADQKLWSTLTTSNDVKQCSDAFLHRFEKPADQSASVENSRASSARNYGSLEASYQPGAAQSAYMAQTPGTDAQAQALGGGIDSVLSSWMQGMGLQGVESLVSGALETARQAAAALGQQMAAAQQAEASASMAAISAPQAPAAPDLASAAAYAQGMGQAEGSAFLQEQLQASIAGGMDPSDAMSALAGTGFEFDPGVINVLGGGAPMPAGQQQPGMGGVSIDSTINAEMQAQALEAMQGHAMPAREADEQVL